MQVKDIKDLDFGPIVSWVESEREKKKLLTKEEKKAIKEAKDEEDKPFSEFLWHSCPNERQHHQ